MLNFNQLIVCVKVVGTLSDMESFSFSRISARPTYSVDSRFSQTSLKVGKDVGSTKLDSMQSQVNLMKEQAVFKSNLAVLQTADKMTGTLLDTFA